MKMMFTTLAALLLLLFTACPADRGQKPPVQKTTVSVKETAMLEKATFGAGCFWGVEETFRKIQGVVSTRVGYAGGTTVNPGYRDVCTGNTGHAEVCEVTFDPAVISYDALLDAFWNMHDPTTWHRQGPDVGSQYRSVIFCHSEAQENTARASLEKIARSGRFRRPIVTEIRQAGPFYPAEDYHQRYIEKKGGASCHM